MPMVLAATAGRVKLAMVAGGFSAAKVNCPHVAAACGANGPFAMMCEITLGWMTRRMALFLSRRGKYSVLPAGNACQLRP